MAASDRTWSDFSFVAASGYRERVLNALSRKPKFPKDVAHETTLRITHVSRALREMGGRGLVECLNPMAKARGRMYGVTQAGASLLAYFDRSSRRFVPSAARETAYVGFVPKIRGSSVLRFLAILRETKGNTVVDAALQPWSIHPKDLSEDTWLSIDSAAELLELVEARFGDGSYNFIRASFAAAGPSFPTIQGELAKRLPLTVLAERAPIVWAKEYNFGRLEVETRPRMSIMRHFDWMPTPAICAAFHGVYEGILRWRGVEGQVRKVRCVRSGDPCCEYQCTW